MEHFSKKVYLPEVPDAFLSGEIFTIVYSGEPGVLQTVPMPDDLAPYYRSEKYSSHNEGGEGLYGTLYRIARRFQFEMKWSWVQSGSKQAGRILDIGTGSAEWLSFVRSKGWEVLGTEPSAVARTLAERKGIPVHSDLSSLKEEAFDLVTLWHVLEHMTDLEFALDSVVQACAPGGILAIGVPNYRSWDARYYGAHWAAWDVPRHLWHFDRAGLVRLVEQRGLKLKRTRAMWLDAFYVSLWSERYRRSNGAFLRALFSGFRSTLYAWRHGEPSSRAFIFEKPF